MPAFQPYRGKLAVRNDRGDRGNVGIIRSPIRASILPDHSGSQAAYFAVAHSNSSANDVVEYVLRYGLGSAHEAT
jgi:hypothetical protein